MNISTTKKRQYTYEDYLRLPEGSPYQLIGGDLIMVPSPTPYHQRISRKIGAILLQHIEENDLGELLYSPIDVFFGQEHTFQPDIIFISKERLSIIGDVKVEGAPDLVIEILSPSTAYYDLGTKYEVYEKSGVKEYWLVHPDRKSIEVYENRNEKFHRVQAVTQQGIIQSKLLKNVTVDLKKIF
ncbi:MAG: Uma2 family endonuclease [Thermodesulfobacteriota bacterium]|nr:Uma2 family endonuclease [Thermodesulfobacteriota bacterium]